MAKKVEAVSWEQVSNVSILNRRYSGASNTGILSLGTINVNGSKAYANDGDFASMLTDVVMALVRQVSPDDAKRGTIKTAEIKSGIAKMVLKAHRDLFPGRLENQNMTHVIHALNNMPTATTENV